MSVSVTLGAPIYNRYKTHERGARKKNFSENLVVSKICRTFALATPKKGWSEVSDTWLEFGGDDSWSKRLRSLYDDSLVKQI